VVIFSVLLLLGVALTLLFALRTARSFRDFRDARGRPPHEALGDIAPWMTVPYVAAVYGVPPDFLFTQLGIPADGNERVPLRILERQHFDGERGVIVDRMRHAVEFYYAGGPTATPALPDPALVPMPDLPGGPDGPGGPGGPDGDPRDGPPDEPPALLATPAPPTAPAAPAPGGQP
jgi:hypothetical protein